MAGLGLRISAFYAALFLIYGVHLPYLPLWLEWRGLTPAEIGIVTSAPFFLRLVATPALAFLADRHANHAAMIQALAFIALGSALALAAVEGFWPILGAALVLAVAVFSIMPLTETVAVGGVRRGLDYGRMRLWGSLTFILASFLGGAAVDSHGRGIGIWLIVAGAAATVAAAFVLPDATGGSDRRLRHAARASAGALEPPLAPTRPQRGIDRTIVLRLVRHPAFLMFLAGIGLVQCAHSMFYTFGAIHWRAGGLSSVWIGVLWAIGVITEVMVFAFSGRLVERFGPVRLMLAGALAAVLRWAAMAFDPVLAWLVPLQVLHGLTYGASHLGAIHFISRAVPEAAGGTAQALYATLAAGVLQGAATLLAGALYPHLGGAAYLAMAVIAGAGLAAQLVLWRHWDGARLWMDAAEAHALVRSDDERGR